MTNTVARLAYDATTKEEVHQYFQTRALQLAWNDFEWSHELQQIDGGYFTQFTKGFQTYDSFYILAQERGNGKAVKALKQVKNPILTVADCKVEEFFRKHNVPVVVASGIYDTIEYKLIEQAYGTKRAERSQVYLMNHIDEGVIIMKKHQAGLDAQKAFCLHPLVQSDDWLKDHFEEVSLHTSARVLAYAMEYRSVANEYLSKRQIESLDEIRLSPLQAVTDMLIADKVQNYKDFTLYHKGTHPWSDRLDKYFNNWLLKLGVTNFNEHFEMLKAI